MDIRELRRRVGEGESFSYRFFWGHRGEGDAYFSQWFPCAFAVDRRRYSSAEQFMMAEKAVLFGDVETLREIRRAEDPSTAKKLGRKVRGFDESKWQAARFEIVVRGNVAKFSQNAKLRKHLLASGDDVLVEASPTDRIWGIGMAKDHPDTNDPRKWRGLNLLGFALMEARTRISSPA